MTPSENRQRLKNEFVNSVIKLHKGPIPNDPYDERSCSEQRDELISILIDKLNDDLKNTK